MRIKFEEKTAEFCIVFTADANAKGTLDCTAMVKIGDLCVGNIPFVLSWEEIEQVYSTCGVLLQERERSLELSDEAKAFKENPTMESALAMMEANKATKDPEN